MANIIIIASILVCCGLASSQIYYGDSNSLFTDATKNNFAYHAALLEVNTFICSAFVISLEYVLFSEYCLQKYVRTNGALNVRVGSSDYSAFGEVIRISDTYTFENVILGKLEKPISTPLNIGVPSVNYAAGYKISDTDDLLISGWYKLIDEKEVNKNLKAIHIYSWTARKCQKLPSIPYEDYTRNYFTCSTPNYQQYGPGKCVGQYGDPIVSDGGLSLIGFTSDYYDCQPDSYNFQMEFINQNTVEWIKEMVPST